MKRLAQQYPRYGYRRIRIFLKREGHTMGWERAHRLWKAAGLQLPRRRPRRRIASSRPRPLPAFAPNSVWAYDFVFDGCANGQQLKCLTIVDEFTRECLAIDVAGSIRSNRVIEILARLVSERGTPAYLRSDNGPEFVSKAILEWVVEANIQIALIDPGKPWQNGTDESFNGKFRDECLSVEWFRSRREAKVIIDVLAATLQPGATALQPRIPHARRIPSASQFHQPGGHPQVANGPNFPGQVKPLICNRGERLGRVSLLRCSLNALRDNRVVTPIEYRALLGGTLTCFGQSNGWVTADLYGVLFAAGCSVNRSISLAAAIAKLPKLRSVWLDAQAQAATVIESIRLGFRFRVLALFVREQFFGHGCGYRWFGTRNSTRRRARLQ